MLRCSRYYCYVSCVFCWWFVEAGNSHIFISLRLFSSWIVKARSYFLAELGVFSDIRIGEGDCVTVRVGTAEVECSVEELVEKIDPVSLRVLERKPMFLGEGEVGRVVLRASEPVCVEAYKDVAQLGRFVIIGRTGTTAAGIIMDVSKTEEEIHEKD